MVPRWQKFERKDYCAFVCRFVWHGEIKIIGYWEVKEPSLFKKCALSDVNIATVQRPGGQMMFSKTGFWLWNDKLKWKRGRCF
jgi:hypothetical protein